MKDTLIINSISKIYFSIVSFFIFIILVLSVTYLLLSSGINLKNISFDSVRIDKLYIKWDEKLNIYIKDINISKKESKSSFDLKSTSIIKHINKIVYLSMFINSIEIKKITYGDATGSLHFTQKNGGSFNAVSSDIDFNSSISTNNKYLNLHINKLENKKIGLKATADIVLNATKNMFFARSTVELKDDLSVDVNLKSNSKKLHYAISSNKSIPSTSYIVSILNMDPRVVYWVDDAIDMKQLDIKQAYGFINYNKPTNALKNFYAYGVAKSLKYTYDPKQKLEPIQTDYTELVFKDGVLFILPNNSTTYDFNLDASWLRIDFTKPQEILTLHLLFDGILNQDLKSLLKRYKINLPFIQNSGYMDTNLILAINLMTLDVDAKGEFYTNKANFTYLGLDLDLNDTLVKLNNFDVDIPKMKAAYKDIASADVDAKLDLKNSKGYINFDLSKIYFSDKLYLDTKKNNLKVKYIIGSNKDSIEIDNSKWLLLGNSTKLENFKLPFNLNSLEANIPTIELSSNNNIHAYISGSANFKKNIHDINFDITKFKYLDIELDQSVVDLNLRYTDDEIKISSKDPISFYSKKQKVNLFNLDLRYKNNSIFTDDSNIEFENFFSSNFDFNYNLDSKDGLITINKFNFSNDALEDIFKINEKIVLKIKSFKDQIIANASSLNISAFHTDKRWVVGFNSLDKIKPYSSFLRRYNIDNGTFSLYKQADEQDIRFTAKLDYDYHLLSKNNKPVSKYIINGISNKENKTSISINDQVNINIQNSNIDAKGSNIEINLNEITKLINSIKSDDSKPSNYSIAANITDSKIILSEQRRVLAESINLQYLNKETTAQLKYKKGEAGFKYKNRNFHMYGAGFGDIFMENLFSMSKFNGGNLDFSIKGNIDNFSGVAFVKDTTIKEFRLLNNVLAFVNTIPSLVTFSLPSYNSKGLDAKNAYMMFNYKNHIYNITNLFLESDELNILGYGNVSLLKNKIDMKLNLKTDLGSAASKIPLVGHIIFDKDSISTSLKIDGNLDDPKIKSMIAKEIIVAPLNIIKRTLLLPFSVFDKK